MVWVQSLIREQRAYKPCSAAKQQQQQQQQSEAKYRKIKKSIHDVVMFVWESMNREEDIG